MYVSSCRWHGFTPHFAKPAMLNLVLPALISFASLVSSQCQPSNATFLFPPTIAPGLTAQLVFSNLSTPRGITFDALNTLLVVERGVGVSSFVGRNDSSCNGFQRELVLDNAGLTHGIEIDGEELYVSTQLQVLLYRYDAHTRSASPGAPKVIVDGLPSDGGTSIQVFFSVERFTDRTRLNDTHTPPRPLPSRRTSIAPRLRWASHQHRLHSPRPRERALAGPFIRAGPGGGVRAARPSRRLGMAVKCQ